MLLVIPAICLDRIKAVHKGMSRECDVVVIRSYSGFEFEVAIGATGAMALHAYARRLTSTQRDDSHRSGRYAGQRASCHSISLLQCESFSLPVKRNVSPGDDTIDVTGELDVRVETQPAGC